MPTLTIDGHTVHADHGQFLLAACRSAGIQIPTLCDHPAVEPYGGCRLCVVDVTRPEWNGWCKMVVACLFPVEDGIVVHTASTRVIEVRKVVLDLLLARCPDTPLVRDLAARHGILATSYVRNQQPTDCILCGLCTRICDRMGMSAIGSVDRGAGREIATPFREPPAACIGCLACAEICPTGFIRYESGTARRKIWDKDFDMLRCPRCGRSHITVAQADFFAGRGGVPRSYFEICDVCKRKDLAVAATRLACATETPAR
jgi:NADH dehydrogenase/NADH:ubiquinone oxidoreductase subunit G